MSIQAMSWVIDQSQARGSTFIVLLMLANHEGDHDGHVYAWPSIDRLAKMSRCSRRTVIGSLADAEKMGELLVTRNAGPNGVHLYHVGRMTECRFCTGAIGVLDLHPKRKEVGSSSTGSSALGGKDVDSKARAARPSTRPTPDQTYLAERICESWGVTRGHLAHAAVQKLNQKYGVEAVTSALRSLRGFPPEEAVQSPYAYIEAICKGEAA